MPPFLPRSRPSRLFPIRVAVLVAFVTAWLATPLPVRAEEGGSVLLWHAYRGDEEKALVELVKRYANETGVHVDTLAIPFDAYGSKLESAVPRDHGPDLFIEAHERLGSYRRQGLVADVGDAFPESDVPLFDDVAVRAVSLEGVRFAVPLASKCLALFVNADLVPGRTAFIEDLMATPKDGVVPVAYEAHSAYFHAPFLHAYGGAMLDSSDHFAFAGDRAERSVAFVADLARRHVIPDEPSGALVQELFVTGKAKAVISGPWFSSDLRDRVRYRVEPLPRLRETGELLRPFLTVEGLFVTPRGRANARARAFARWYGAADAGRVRALVGRQVVPLKSVWTDAEVAADRTLAAFHEGATLAVPMPTSTAMRSVWVPAEQALRKVLRGDAEPRSALDEARRRFEDILRPPPPARSPTPLLLLFGALLAAGAVTLVRRVSNPTFRKELRASVPAYAYVAHAVLTVMVLVVLPLVAGALTSFFVGTRDAPRFVGVANYVAILTARGGPLLASGSFWLTLLVTVVWTVVNVAFHVGIGLVLGIVLSRPMMKLRAAYRVLLVLPWAVPSYVTALAWKGMFHRQFGAVNGILTAIGAEPVSWFSHFSTAFAANVATNVWLGFPFMMVVTMGALTSIPKEVLEAAEVDGATRWQRFRLVTFPLLAPALLPSVILGSVWTFNMFNVVFLVSGGEPDGTTDILVSEAYRWAFTRDAQYGYAAAYAVLIFLLLAGGSKVLRRLAGGDEALA
ncbi:MAG: extracellular solute-binding protein [Polyangiaceae bacterium]